MAAQEARLEAWLDAKFPQKPCLGCGASSPYQTAEPYLGHFSGCVLVQTWRVPLVPAQESNHG